MSSLDKFRNKVSGLPLEAHEVALIMAQEVTPKTHPLVKAATRLLEEQAEFEVHLREHEIEVG